jgi:hypothetical protein
MIQEYAKRNFDSHIVVDKLLQFSMDILAWKERGENGEGKEQEYHDANVAGAPPPPLGKEAAWHHSSGTVMVDGRKIPIESLEYQDLLAAGKIPAEAGEAAGGK